nr:hypothetical protein [Tanacetum cinerariifolium]
DLVDYDGDDEEPEEEPKEEPEQQIRHGNQFAQHPNPQPGNMNGWLEEDDDVNKNVNNEDIKDEDVEVEVDYEAELIFPYEMEGDQTPPPRDESSDSVSSDSESEDKEADIAPEATARTVAKGQAELSTTQAGIALLKPKNKIGEKERKLLDQDLGDIEYCLRDVESVGEWGECYLKEEVGRERDAVEVLYGDGSQGAVPKPSSEDESTERPRKKSMKPSSNRTEGPSKPREPPSDSQ